MDSSSYSSIDRLRIAAANTVFVDSFTASSLLALTKTLLNHTYLCAKHVDEK